MSSRTSLPFIPSSPARRLFEEIKADIDAFCTDERRMFMFLERLILLRRRMIINHNLPPYTRSVSAAILEKLAQNDQKPEVIHISSTVKNSSPLKRAASDDIAPASVKRSKARDKTPSKSFSLSQIVRKMTHTHGSPEDVSASEALEDVDAKMNEATP